MHMNRYRNSIRRVALSCALMLAPLATQVAAEETVALSSGTSFAERRAVIEKALSSSRRYSEISREDRKAVLKALERISGTLQQAPSVAELPPDVAEGLQRDQSFVNDTLARAEAESELRCSTQASLGSNIRSRSCETKAAKQRREAEQAANGPPRLDVIR